MHAHIVCAILQEEDAWQAVKAAYYIGASILEPAHICGYAHAPLPSRGHMHRCEVQCCMVGDIIFWCIAAIHSKDAAIS